MGRGQRRLQPTAQRGPLLLRQQSSCCLQLGLRMRREMHCHKVVNTKCVLEK
jgi:hypothetical protein